MTTLTVAPWVGLRVGDGFWVTPSAALLGPQAGLRVVGA
jgi:hypothetical protein